MADVNVQAEVDAALQGDLDAWKAMTGRVSAVEQALRAMVPGAAGGGVVSGGTVTLDVPDLLSHLDQLRALADAVDAADAGPSSGVVNTGPPVGSGVPADPGPGGAPPVT